MSQIPELPDELWLHILEQIKHLESLHTISLLNQRFHALVQEESIWKELCYQYKFNKEARCSSSTSKAFFKHCFILDYNWRNATQRRECQQKLDVRGAAPRIMSRSGAWAIKGVSAALAANVPASINATNTSFDGRVGVVSSGRVRTLSVVAYMGSHVQVYDLSASVPVATYAIPEDKVRTMVLVLSNEPSKETAECAPGVRGGDGMHIEERLGPGVFRGWGNKQMRLITGGEKIKVWRLPTRIGEKPVVLTPTASIRCLTLVNAYLVSGSRDGSVALWNLQTNEKLGDLEGFMDSVMCLDAHRTRGIVIGGSMDKSAKVWHLSTGMTLRLLGHQLSVHRVLLDDHRAFTASMDSSVRMWDVDTGDCMCVLTTHRTSVIHLGIFESLGCMRSLVSVCFSGIAAVHGLSAQSKTATEYNDEALAIDESIYPHSKLVANSGAPLPKSGALASFASDTPPIKSSKGFNLHLSQIVDVASNESYYVVGSLDGQISVFQPIPIPQEDQEPMQRTSEPNGCTFAGPVVIGSSTPLNWDDSAGRKRNSPVKLIRTIETGLYALFRVSALPNGIVVVGTKDNGEMVLIHYDFTPR
ncbi:SubName: Full=Related to F-box/WD40 repeat protein 7 {ECO:0000313/EMBL:CCA72625.1} [Serendipita indica DSM 11827]|nr:SubName: Full=Related to F-box/WD40 repeat protein 7 {ECO:0000313/EMBL:CCA72625.1} [Serendipita indica DSM 11827]